VGGKQYSWKVILISIKLDEYVPAFQIAQSPWLDGCHVGGLVVVNGHVWRSAVVDVEQLSQNEVMDNIVLT
jgi:hypothetical protein